MKVIFLDIDGVLNHHEFNQESQSCTINAECITQLNRILKETSAKIVLSSAWRYVVTGHAMTLEGFRYMLQTHGLRHGAEIIGHTITDETCYSCEYECLPSENQWDDNGRHVCVKCGHHTGRSDQIRHWLRAHRGQIERCVVIDDLPIENLPFIQTDSKVGLTKVLADAVIAILKGQ